jgi:opacity protein-like surface antigen
MKEKYGVLKIILVAALLACVGCAPSSFVKSSSGWKVIEVREGLNNDCNKAWQTTVDTIARNWDIEMMDKESGYLRTAWTYGIGGGVYSRYRGRLTVKFTGGQCDKLEVRTEAQWLEDYYGNWIEGFDTTFNRDVYGTLSGRLGRTVPTE